MYWSELWESCKEGGAKRLAHALLAKEIINLKADNKLQAILKLLPLPWSLRQQHHMLCSSGDTQNSTAQINRNSQSAIDSPLFVVLLLPPSDVFSDPTHSLRLRRIVQHPMAQHTALVPSPRINVTVEINSYCVVRSAVNRSNAQRSDLGRFTSSCI